MEEKNILDDVFKTPEEEVETFVEAMSELITDPNTSDASRIVHGRPEKISYPELVIQRSGLIGIQHGWDGQNYVWHISPIHPKRPWKVSMDRVVYSIAKTMNTVIPNTTTVNFWLPHQEWEIAEITFKALDLKNVWSISNGDLEEVNKQLFEILNTLV